MCRCLCRLTHASQLVQQVRQQTLLLLLLLLLLLCIRYGCIRPASSLCNIQGPDATVDALALCAHGPLMPTITGTVITAAGRRDGLSVWGVERGVPEGIHDVGEGPRSTDAHRHHAVMEPFLQCIYDRNACLLLLPVCPGFLTSRVGSAACMACIHLGGNVWWMPCSGCMAHVHLADACMACIPLMYAMLTPLVDAILIPSVLLRKGQVLYHSSSAVIRWHAMLLCRGQASNRSRSAVLW
mmetsp:Transcript_15334/g.40454  ORF Transcript_15334/g.40454 Transcript_15334/m.40454 type:complete len:240 (+) Transcript_15334:523-1242(+)